MKAIFVSCDQALYDEVQQIMSRLGVRGFTSWEEVRGCGGTTGDPHLGDYAWPMMNTAFISMVDEPVASEFLAALRALDEANPKMGLRAFWWEIGGTF